MTGLRGTLQLSIKTSERRSAMEAKTEKRCVMIIAGEASGDHHGARLVQAMQRRAENLFFCGIGGGALKEAGVRVLVDAASLSVVGVTEVFAKLPNLIKGVVFVKRLLKSLRPDLLILIDFPDFNLFSASVAKKLGIPILYYISPQVWAWRSGRVKKIQRLVNHMAVILPFEVDYYRNHQVPVTFVGHPLLDGPQGVLPAVERPSADLLTIGLVPGSRDTEVARHLPLMLNAASLLHRRMNHLRFLVSQAPTVDRNHVAALISQHKAQIPCELAPQGMDQVFKRCSFAVVASGTVSLETAISGIPMIIIYKLSPLSYWLGRLLIRVRHIGLINLIAGRTIVPELIQNEASPEKIADTVFGMLKDPAGLEKTRSELAVAVQKLGGAGASERAADIALGLLQR